MRWLERFLRWAMPDPGWDPVPPLPDLDMPAENVEYVRAIQLERLAGQASGPEPLSLEDELDHLAVRIARKQNRLLAIKVAQAEAEVRDE